MLPESSALMSSSIATTLKPTAPSSATFSTFPPWTPAAAGSYLPCLPRKLEFTPPTARRGQSHGGRKLLGSVLYLMCDNLPALMKSLQAKGVTCSPAEEEDWGIKTTIQLPSGGEIGLYQPTHPTALGLR